MPGSDTLRVSWCFAPLWDPGPGPTEKRMPSEVRGKSTKRAQKEHKKREGRLVDYGRRMFC